MPPDLHRPPRAIPRHARRDDPAVTGAQKTVLLALLALVILVVAVGTIAVMSMLNAGHEAGAVHAADGGVKGGSDAMIGAVATKAMNPQSPRSAEII